MASESETVMAVCAEWRDCIEAADPSVWNDERIAGLVKTTKAQQLAYLARIEAAWKRERESLTLWPRSWEECIERYKKAREIHDALY